MTHLMLYTALYTVGGNKHVYNYLKFTDSFRDKPNLCIYNKQRRNILFPYTKSLQHVFKRLYNVEFIYILASGFISNYSYTALSLV